MNASAAPLNPTEDERILRNLAQDIVRNIQDPLQLLSKYGITQPQYDEVAKTRVYREMLSQSALEWGAAGNTAERIKLKSAALIEDSLPELGAFLVDKKETLSSRVSLLQTLAKLGSLGGGPVQSQGDGHIFRMTINLGDNKTPVIIDQKVADLPSEVTEPQSIEFGGDE